MKSFTNQSLNQNQSESISPTKQEESHFEKEQKNKHQSNQSFFSKKYTDSSENNEASNLNNVGLRNFNQLSILPPKTLPLQPKLKVNPSNDKYEQEADRIANQVVRSSNPFQISPTPFPKTFLQTKSESGRGMPVSQNFHNQIQISRGGGVPLNENIRSFMEPRMGFDFGKVRIHDNLKAAQLNQEINAKAFTVGNDIYFNSGQYHPNSVEGKHLLSHELTHVIQQKSSPNLIQRIGFFESVARFFGGGTFSEEELKKYISKIEKNNKIEDAYDSDNKAREVVMLWKTGKIALSKELKVLLIREMFSGFTGNVDEQAILELLKAPIEEQTYIFTKISPQEFRDEFHGTEYKKLELIIDTWMDRFPSLPTPDLAREIGYDLEPSSRPTSGAITTGSSTIPSKTSGANPSTKAPPPKRIPWDGRDGAPGAANARKKMKAELFNAFDAYLNFYRSEVLKRLKLPRIPFTAPATGTKGSSSKQTGVVDIANQARGVLETKYGVSMNSASSSPKQVEDRSIRRPSGANQNIFDPYSEADRQKLTGQPNIAKGMAWWLFDNDKPGATDKKGDRKFATEITAVHNFSVQDAGAEDFRRKVADDYAKASTLKPSNRRQLIDYNLAMASQAGEKGITLTSAYDPSWVNKEKEITLDMVKLFKRWQIFYTAIHESLHLRTHPAFRAATQGRATMLEGFTEMFTIATLNKDVLPRVRAGKMEKLRRTVEGAISTRYPNERLIPDRISPSEYVPHRKRAERIRDGGKPVKGVRHIGIGEKAVQAAYFQGHVEFLGLTATGAQITTGLPTLGEKSKIRIPEGIKGLDDLAKRSGVPRTIIERDNPGITDSLPDSAILSGCREHWVISGETRKNIADQNGVEEAKLVQANPNIVVDPSTKDWSSLSAGKKILIPVP